MLLPEGSHQWPAELLFISMGCFLRGEKVASLLLPESPTGSPAPRRSLGPRGSLGPLLWSVPDAAGVWKGTTEECGGFTAALIDRGQDEVGSHISGLWSPLSRFLSYRSQPYPIYPFCCHVSWCLCLIPCWDRVELSGEQTLQVWLCASPLLSV